MIETIRRLQGTFPLLVLCGASGFFLYDIIVDLARGTDSALHLALEAGVFILTSIALFIEIRRVLGLRRQVGIAHDQVSRLTGDLYRLINEQFDEWDLTDTEKEIALLLIKGLSMREISALRKVKEKTIRQQAANIYAKAGYSNRSELASHFIQDLINSPSA